MQENLRFNGIMISAIGVNVGGVSLNCILINLFTLFEIAVSISIWKVPPGLNPKELMKI